MCMRFLPQTECRGIWRPISDFVATAALTLLAMALPCAAQSHLCNELEAVRPGDYLHSYTQTHLKTSTRRPSGESSAVGQSAVKGAMARRISGELNGASVQWSSAMLVGPIACASFNAYQIVVDPRLVRIVDVTSQATPP